MEGLTVNGEFTPEQLKRLNRLVWNGCTMLLHLATLCTLCAAADEVKAGVLHAALLICAAVTYGLTLRVALLAIDEYRAEQ